MMRRRTGTGLAAAGVVVGILSSAALAANAQAPHGLFWRHSNWTRVHGIVTSFALTPSSGSTTIGSITLATPTSGSVTASVLASTTIEAPAQVLADQLAGADATVTLAPQSGGGFLAESIEAAPYSANGVGTVTLVGTIASVAPPAGGAPGSITLTVGSATVQAALDANVQVTVGATSGTQADLKQGERVVATMEWANSTWDVVSVRISPEAGRGPLHWHIPWGRMRGRA